MSKVLRAACLQLHQYGKTEVWRTIYKGYQLRSPTLHSLRCPKFLGRCMSNTPRHHGQALISRLPKVSELSDGMYISRSSRHEGQAPLQHEVASLLRIGDRGSTGETTVAAFCRGLVARPATHMQRRSYLVLISKSFWPSIAAKVEENGEKHNGQDTFLATSTWTKAQTMYRYIWTRSQNLHKHAGVRRIKKRPGASRTTLVTKEDAMQYFNLPQASDSSS
ncbi:hypothetical protein V8C34DRAFT_80492 [Trichoderma compactum]